MRSSFVAYPSSSSCDGAIVTSSSRTSFSSSSWIVIWKTSWTSSSVSSTWAYCREDCPVWMMVCFSTFSCPFVSTSKVVWPLCVFPARPSSFSSFGIVFLFLEVFLVSTRLSEVDRHRRELAVLLCFFGFDNLSKTELWGVGVLSSLKTEVRS
ncbi:hypothetical protein FF2_013129 [Malus domestica]